MPQPSNGKCSVVPHIRLFGTSKHTNALRKGQNRRRWGATEELLIILFFLFANRLQGENQALWHCIENLNKTSGNGIHYRQYFRK